MAVIRHIKIGRFRSIFELDWYPAPGINCLVGPGDSGKSTILDAIDYCLNPRRYLQFFESDFHQLNSADSIVIDITIGDLEQELLKLESYLNFMRGFNAAAKRIEDEPGLNLEPVLTVRMEVLDDLVPRWRLFSERTEAQAEARDLAYGDRIRISPSRLGSYADSQLAWGQRSILNKLGSQRPDAGKALAAARKQARIAFIDSTKGTFDDVLEVVSEVAKELAVDVGIRPKAILDTGEVAIATGSVALHDADEIPLHALGLGSSRLLVAGLQRRASQSQIAIIDELEHGLEPYRIVQLLHVLGSKSGQKNQTFITTHSPVVVRELSAEQIVVIRRPDGSYKPHRAIDAGGHVRNQKVIRACAEALLTPRILVCEGKTEVGFVRGLDLIRHEGQRPTLAHCGVYAADGGGSEASSRALAFRQLGYDVALLRDNDVELSKKQLANLTKANIPIFQWDGNKPFEAALLECCPAVALLELLDIAIEARGQDTVDADIRAVSDGAINLAMCRDNLAEEVLRKNLIAASTRKSDDGTITKNWFKLIEPAERVAHEVYAKHAGQFGAAFRKVVNDLKAWVDTSAPDEAAAAK
ncbi:putative ATP-dependent endonuclease of OLD family [Bradyrhizobium sp. USDA 4503]